MRDIAAAAAEQSAGIDQVGDAVTQMDSVTQQNAALVEQAAAVAQTLTEQANLLQQSICTFQLQEGEGNQPAPRFNVARANVREFHPG
jgi:methyl-accepting chemotaxis protein